jgi:uncharacterized membrane protein YbhN (UPF0104 family)
VTADDLLWLWPLLLAALLGVGIAVAWLLVWLSDYAMRRHYRRILDDLEGRQEVDR